RGVGFSGGHFHRNWAVDGYRKLVLNAIAWVAHLEVPRDGVRSKPVSEDDLNANLDPKGKTGPRLTVPRAEEFATLERVPIPPVVETKGQKAAPKTEKRGPDAGSNRQTSIGVPASSPSPASATAIAPAPAAQAAMPAPAIPERGEFPSPVSKLHVPKDLEVTLWARSPQLFNPTNMDTDSEGRIWVAEGVNYRKLKNRRPGGDRIVVLTDSDGDGKADQSQVFVEDPELVSPLGISVMGNRVIVAQPPHLIVYTDVNRNQRFDPGIDTRENLLSGFLGANHDHSLHSVVAGPDGRWYFNQGNTGAEFTTRDGVTYRIGGPYAEGTRLSGARSDDGRIWTGGFAASMSPDGTDLRIIGHGFRNSYEQCVTSFGDVYQNDNDDPPACRTTWLMEGGFMGFFSRSGKRTWEADRRRGQSIPVAQWRQEDPGTLPPGDVYGRGAPTGIAYYENGALPDRYHGLLLSAESRLQTIFGYYPAPDGANFRLERFDFLRAEEGSYFRPADVMVGADGAIYVADWFDERVGGHGTRDDALYGAIYRIAPKGFRPRVPPLARTSDGRLSPEGALAALRSPAPNVRHEGQLTVRSLAANSPALAQPLVQALHDDPNPYLRARGAWLLTALGAKGQPQLESLLGNPDPQQRILGLRVLRQSGFDFVAQPALLERLVRDPSVAVRRETALMLRPLPHAKKQPWVEQLFLTCDGTDRTYLEACGLAAEGIEAAVWSALRTRLGMEDPLRWSDAFATLTWRLQPPAAVSALTTRARSGTLAMPVRKQAVDTLAFTRTREALAAMVELRRSEPAFAEQATAWLLVRASDEWEDFGGRQVLKQEGIYDPDKVQIQDLRMPDPMPDDGSLRIEAIRSLTGDAARGRTTVARCFMCHRIGDQGVEYGPDLQGWVANQGTEAFLKAVITPSDSVALGYEGERVPLKDGREVQGIILSSSDPITVRSTGGVTQMIPRAMLDKRTLPMRRSLMYSAAELGLSAQDLADLAAYLKTYL
ncbi:MAG: HEAT repeat domain-containing protein, partial [Opitutaceae bacterium]|nr:HEAT repeat domain-containing protein [Opitutaceae bacterium]